MKKSLIALAALAATGAFAQSTVTISGNLDFAGANITGSQSLAKGTTFSTTAGTSSTSVIRITAVEDLGGGMRATAHYGLDPRSLANDGMNYNPQAASETSNGVINGLNRDEVFVGLSGGFGTLRLGSPNSLGLTVNGLTSPLGTGVGSGYALSQLYSAIRYDRAARYDSPNFNGLTAHIQYAPGNDQPFGTGSAGAAQLPVAIRNNRQVTEFALVYSAGNFNLGYVNISQAATTNGTGFFDSTTAGIAAVKTSTNVLGANLNFGATTVYAGYNNGDTLSASLGSTKGYRLAVKHTVGSWDLMAQYTVQEPTKAVASKHIVQGLRADYNLSKRSAAYFGYESYDSGQTYAQTSSSLSPYTGTRKIVSAGLRHSF